MSRRPTPSGFGARSAHRRLLDLRVLESEAFFQAVEKFVNTLETWQKVIADYRPVAEEVGDAVAGLSAPSGFPSPAMDSGFIQI